MYRFRRYSAVRILCDELAAHHERQAQAVHGTKENVGHAIKSIDPIDWALVSGLRATLFQGSPTCTGHEIAIACGVDSVQLRREAVAQDGRVIW